jgi:hypothetical protein
MIDDEKLPREVVWDGAHVSEVALTCIADGQERIVDAGAVQHVLTCEWCSGRLGRAALLSEAVTAGVRQAVAHGERSSAVASGAPLRAAPKPWRALAAGVVVAMLAGLPMLGHLGHVATFLSVFFTRGVPVLARGGLALAANESVRGALPVATLGASALLVMLGLAIARSRSRSAEGSAS